MRCRSLPCSQEASQRCRLRRRWRQRHDAQSRSGPVSVGAKRMHSAPGRELMAVSRSRDKYRSRATRDCFLVAPLHWATQLSSKLCFAFAYRLCAYQKEFSGKSTRSLFFARCHTPLAWPHKVPDRGGLFFHLREGVSVERARARADQRFDWLAFSARSGTYAAILLTPWTPDAVAQGRLDGSNPRMHCRTRQFTEKCAQNRYAVWGP